MQLAILKDMARYGGLFMAPVEGYYLSFEEISIRPELSSPPRFRIQAGSPGRHTRTDRRTDRRKDGRPDGQRTEILVSNKDSRVKSAVWSTVQFAVQCSVQ